MKVTRPPTGWKIQDTSTHPGTVLREDFLAPANISANQLALSTRMPATRIGEILNGRRSVSPDTALRLARYFSTSAEFWLNLQAAHDLSKARTQLEQLIEREVQPRSLDAVAI